MFFFVNQREIYRLKYDDRQSDNWKLLFNITWKIIVAKHNMVTNSLCDTNIYDAQLLCSNSPTLNVGSYKVIDG